MKKGFFIILILLVFGISICFADVEVRNETSYYTDQYGNYIKKVCCYKRITGPYASAYQKSWKSHGCRETIIRKAPRPPKRSIHLGD